MEGALNKVKIRIMAVLTRSLPKYIHSRLIPLIESESYFQLIRSNILKRTTATELEVAARIAKATDHHDMGTIDASSAVSTKRKQNSKWDNNLIIHYSHEKRFETLKSLHGQQRPYSTADLYQYAIIAVCKYYILATSYHYTSYCDFSFSCYSTERNFVDSTIHY